MNSLSERPNEMVGRTWPRRTGRIRDPIDRLAANPRPAGVKRLQGGEGHFRSYLIPGTGGARVRRALAADDRKEDEIYERALNE